MDMMGLVIVIAVILFVTIVMGFIATYGTYKKPNH